MASYMVLHAAKNPKLAQVGANLAKSSILVPKVISRSIEVNVEIPRPLEGPPSIELCCVFL